MASKVSAIVPIYKVEQYLERCVDSLIGQTLEDIEIILVDDGSPDGCPAMCDRYRENNDRVKVIHKKNGGVSAARNDGLAAASGEYVIFCDSDDWMEPDALETLYDAVMEKDADVAVGDIHLIKGEQSIYNKYFEHEFYYTNRKDMDRLVMADIYQGYSPDPPVGSKTIGYGGPWNKLVRRKFLLDHDIRFDVSLLGIFDDILYTAYVYANMDSIVYIHKPVYNYVDLASSITNAYKANSLDINERIFTAFRKFIGEYGADGRWDKAFDALVVRRFVECLQLYFFSSQNEKGYKETIHELKETMEREPYLSAAKNVEIDRLSVFQVPVVRCMKAGSATGIWALYKLKKCCKAVLSKRGGVEGPVPKFSVVVPVYKVEPYLERCIRSLMNQTLRDIEIILVDDGSPDSCPAICDRYAAMDDRITVIHKKNEGVSAARNDGLAMASGDWVIFCDSDDWMEEDACENLYNAGEENGADVVIADIYRVVGDKRSYCKLFDREYEYTAREDIKDVVLSVFYQTHCSMTQQKALSGFGGPWNKAIRRELIAEHGIQFDPDLMGVHDDRLFNLNAYVNAGKIRYIHKAVYNYVQVENSITRSYKPNVLEINDAIFRKFEDFIAEFYPGDAAVRAAYQAMVVNRLYDALGLYFFNDENKMAWAEKRRQLMDVWSSEPYQAAIVQVDTARLFTSHKYTVIAMRTKLPEMVRILCGVKDLLKKIRT